LVKDIIMEIRNAISRNIDNTIVDVEINHPIYGWIPYTFKSNEPDESFDLAVREYLYTATIANYIPEDIDTLKLRKLNEIKNEVDYIKQNVVITSSVGFTVNARREDIQNIDELITLGVTSFRGADNVMHTVTATDLQIIRAEIVAEGLSLYNRKWAAEDALANATTEAEVMAITL